MPFVNITTAKKLSDGKKAELYSRVGELMPVIPGKNLDNTLVCINDGASMFMKGKPNNAAFVSVQCFKKSPEESKKEFSKKIYAVLKDILEFDSESCLYMNFTEFETWATNGNYNT